ncbi:cytoplasmic protein, partial [Bacillus mycoides]
MNEIIRLIDSYMVKIPAGEIVLRDDRIKREWKAQIKPFLLAQYTVT